MRKSTRIITIALGIVIVGLLAWRLSLRPSSSLRQQDLTATYGRVADFSFTDQAGKPFTLGDLKGKVWIADFMFTRCMGPCPLLTTRMAELQKEFKDKDAHFVSFSVDPDFDTPPVLAAYAKNYGADTKKWHFLTGPKEKMYGLIRESFHLAVEQVPPQKPSVTDIMHSLYFVLVDADATVIGYFNTTDPDAMASLRRKLKSL